MLGVRSFGIVAGSAEGEWFSLSHAQLSLKGLQNLQSNSVSSLDNSTWCVRLANTRPLANHTITSDSLFYLKQNNYIL